MYLSHTHGEGGWGCRKTVEHITSGFEKKDPDQAETQSNTSSYNAEIMKYSLQSTKLPFQDAFGAPEGAFGGEGSVIDQFGIGFANLSLVFCLTRVFLIKSRFGPF